MNNERNYRRILVATDFSPYAEAALKQAVWLARRTGAQIVMANVIPDRVRFEYWAPHEQDMTQEELFQRSETRMRQMVADQNAMDLDVRFVTSIGEPIVGITHAVQSEGYDLVLAGTRGCGKLDQFFIGSTAKRLIRNCPSSVWIVKAEHLVSPNVVLAATDFSDASLKAVQEGLRIAQLSNAEFHLLHIIDSSDIPEDLIDRIPKGSSFEHEINLEAKKRLERFVDSLGIDRTQIQLHLSWGSPWQEIQRISRHQAADLIVIGTVGRSGIKGLFLGNTAEKILDTCDCSILAVKPDGFVSPIESASKSASV